MFDALSQMWDMFKWQIVSGMIVGSGCAAFGVFVVLRGVIFIGIALTQGAAFGVALALIVGVAPFWGASAVSAAIVALLAATALSARFGRDAVLGVVFSAASAGAPLIVAHSAFQLHNVTQIFYGDLTIMGNTEAAVLSFVGSAALAFIIVSLRGLVTASVDRPFARSIGMRVWLWDTIYFLALAVLVSAAARGVGSVLVFSYLVVAPLFGLTLTRTIKTSILLACLLAVVSTFLGFWLSFILDLTTNLLISAVMTGGLVCALPLRAVLRLPRR